MCISDDTKDYDFSAVTCTSGFSNLYIELADSESRENLLANEAYTASVIAISGSETIEFATEKNI